MPVGMKNRPDGSVGTAVDAIRAASVPHWFTGIDESGTPAVLHTSGNADCHLILRGGAAGPNYDAAAVADALGLLRAAGLPERLIIDASHGNSGKDPERQPVVVADVAAQLEAGQRGIVGVMLESFLVPGRQDLQPGRPPVYGQSVTDGCLGWDQTGPVLARLASAAARRVTS
jgi:3-deoxy-7-phosphoheptulonate synthase